MTSPLRAIRALLPTILILAMPLAVQAQIEPPPPIAGSVVAVPAPQYLDLADPWIFRGTDIPVDREWLMGELPNGVRYAVRRNGVPPGQVSLRVAIDAGSLYEHDDELGFAHLIEHLTFRQSRYFGDGEAIPHFQRWGATLGADTNATTSPTQTVFKLDLPNAQPQRLDDSVRLFSGMIAAPTLSAANLAADVPIVLAERRDQAGAGRRIAEATRALFFKGQLLAERGPIGTVEALQSATPAAVQAFHQRWYRPENAVVVMVGDADPQVMAGLIERYFGDWQVPGDHTPEPSFGAPTAPALAPADTPVGDTKVLVEPGQPRAFTYAVLRPYVQVQDNLEYNRLLLIDSVALSIINQRLESRARAGGSYLYAGVDRQKISRSSDGTYVTFAPLTDDWQTALTDVRSVVADATTTPPTQDEIDRAVLQLEVAFTDMVGQAQIQAGSKLADDLVNAVDIREAVAAPETFLAVFRQMKDRFTPAAILSHTQALFEGNVIRSVFLTPEAGVVDEAAVRQAMLAPVIGTGEARDARAAIAFADLPPIGASAVPVIREPLGFRDVEKFTWANGVRALVWRTDNEPGRVTVRVRFGTGWEGIHDDEGVYAQLGQLALVNSGFGPVGQDDLDRLAAGRKLTFDFSIEEGTFQFEGLTRSDDVADQLYLFAAKLAQPRWDAAPVERAKASAVITYDSYATNPNGVINRDLDWLLRDREKRFATPNPDTIRKATPEEFEAVWSRLLARGPVEVDVFGDIDREATVAALNQTFGALAPRPTGQRDPASKVFPFPKANARPAVLTHSGDDDQAAAVIAWPTGGGSADLAEGRKLELLAQVFGNRLLDALRERAGAAYSPFVSSSWPRDVASGGTILALVQVRPEQVASFFAEAETIAADLAATGPNQDELARVMEPVRQTLARAQTGHTFWLNQLGGAAFDPAITAAAQPAVLWNDYIGTTAQELRVLAERYLTGRGPYKLGVLPQQLASDARRLLSAPARTSAAPARTSALPRATGLTQLVTPISELASQ